MPKLKWSTVFERINPTMLLKLERLTNLEVDNTFRLSCDYMNKPQWSIIVSQDFVKAMGVLSQMALEVKE